MIHTNYMDADFKWGNRNTEKIGGSPEERRNRQKARYMNGVNTRPNQRKRN